MGEPSYAEEAENCLDEAAAARGWHGQSYWLTRAQVYATLAVSDACREKGDSPDT